MKRLFMFASLAAVMAVLSAPVLEACGAKFLVASRAARYLQAQAAESASIFLYWNEATEAEDPQNYQEFREVLENVGHSIEATMDEEVFLRAMRSGEFDIVMMPVAAAAEYRTHVASLAPNATLVPVLEYATRAEKSRTEEEFGRALATPTSSKNVLALIEDSLGD